jgi:hypothetical protein
LCSSICLCALLEVLLAQLTISLRSSSAHDVCVFCVVILSDCEVLHLDASLLKILKKIQKKKKTIQMQCFTQS